MMEHLDCTPSVTSDDFARRFSMRGRSLMWLLGAGASAAAGVPTAYDMIWEFKQKLYVSQKRVSPKAVGDLSNAAVRNELQSHIDSAGRFPAPGAPDEYAALFEAVWPDEGDRRTYIDGKLTGARPSYGHLALATLMKANLADIVWTTNFDPLIADAAAKVYDSTGALTTVSLDAPDLALEAISQQRWPIEIKLHGDFRSRRLKNTSDELRQQDARLRRVLIDTLRTRGLIVVGYSGRDDSIMDSLDEAIEQDNAFPMGFFWLHRGDDQPLERVRKLLTKAAAKRIDCGLVRIVNFDEALRDIVRLCKGLDTTAIDTFAAERRRWSPAPVPTGPRGWPIIRLNALPITYLPTHCRLIACSAGGHAAVREAVSAAGVTAIVARIRAGVIAFGKDSDLRSAFDNFAITDFALYDIDTKRLRHETGERGLLREALSTAIARRLGLDLYRRRGQDLLAPADVTEARWGELQRLVGSISGLVPNTTSLHWREGICLRLDWANERPWLLIDPRIVFDGIDDTNRTVAADFGRERTARRYNREQNKLISFWSELVAQQGEPLRALNIKDGVDAVFRLGSKTGFSRRATS